MSPRTTLLALAFVSTACSGKDDDPAAGGPIDGTWRVDSQSCNGKALAIPKLTVNIAGATGTFVIEVPNTCTATVTEEYTYPNGTSIAITPKSNLCKPTNAACAVAFGGNPDCPTPPPSQLAFVRSGNQLTLTKPSAGPPADPCPAGETLEIKMTKQ